PHDRGRHPLSHHTRRVMGFRPSRASSSAHTSTTSPGFATRNRLTRRRKFFPRPAGRAVGRPGWLGRGTWRVNPRSRSHRHPVTGPTTTPHRSRTYSATFGPAHSPPSGGRFWSAAYRASRPRAEGFG